MRLKLFVGMGLWVASACGSDPGEAILSRNADPVRDGGTGLDEKDAAKSPVKDAGPQDAGKKDSGPSTRPDAGAPAACESHSVSSMPTIPEMLIVLDRSGSMNSNGNEQRADRWSGSIDAISEVTGAYDQRIDFGLMTFPAYVENPGLFDDLECAPGTVNVPIGQGMGTQIADVLGAMDANGRTPTAASLTAALEVLDVAQVGDNTTEAPKYVLLVTDGDPNCSGGDLRNGTDATARQQTVAAIQALAKAGIKTYVVGYQTAGTEFAQQLDLMAQAGATGETSHRSVNSGADLSAALEQVASRVISCSQKLEKPVDDPSYVLVTVDGTPRMFGNAGDGWTLGADDQTVTLTGAACDELQMGARFEVEVQCAPVIVQ